MRPILPKPTEDKVEQIALLVGDPRWKKFEEYLKECFDYTVGQLGDVESERDDDQVLKGMKLTIEHILMIPGECVVFLEVQEKEKEKEEEEDGITLEKD